MEKRLTINELVRISHEMAKQKGWHNRPRSPLEIHMLIVSELAEATEEARKGKPPVYQTRGAEDVLPTGSWWDEKAKPEGELIELADAMIRIADYVGLKGWDLERAIEMKFKFNATRTPQHGGRLY